MESVANSKRNLKLWWIVGAIVLVVVVGFGAFFGGISYQKHHESGARLASSNFAGGLGGDGFRHFNGTIGAVTAVSSTSITVQDQRSGASTTYSINSSTTITQNGATATVSDISTSDTVLVRASSSSSTTAASIDINPAFGGGGSGFGGGTQQD